MISVDVSRGQFQRRNTNRLRLQSYDNPLISPAILANFVKS